MGDGGTLLKLTKAEALVLFDWLVRTSASDGLWFEDLAERKVLWMLEGQLEKMLTEPLSPDYERLLAEARAQVRS